MGNIKNKFKKNPLEYFLVWELISLHKEQGSKDFENIVRGIFDRLTKINNKFFFIKYFDYLYNSFHSFSKKRIYFKGDRFRQFITKTKKEFPVGMIVSGINDRLYAIKNFIPYISFSPLYKDIDKYFKTKNKKYLDEVISKMEILLKDKGIDSIVLWNDCFPLDRAIVLEARKRNIHTIQIQVGMHISTYQPENGREADFVFVWGDFFKNMYNQYKVRSKKNVYTLGYPKKIKKYPSVKEIRKVVYLGQNLEKFNKSHLKTKIETINRLSKICKEIGLTFEYRPHPNDQLKFNCPSIQDIKFSTGPLQDTLDKADVLISFFSTSLIESVMANKIGIQLRNYKMKVGNFEELGICKSFSNLKQVKEYLTKIKNNPKKGYIFKFNSNYISQPKDVEIRFIKLLKKVLKKE